MFTVTSSKRTVYLMISFKNGGFSYRTVEGDIGGFIRCVKIIVKTLFQSPHLPNSKFCTKMELNSAAQLHI